MNETESETPDAEPKSLVEKIINEFRELGVTVLVFLPIWFFFSLFVYELRSIPSESMVPNLQVGDRVAVSKFAYGYSRSSVPLGLGRFLPLGEGRLFGSEPERGDVVVFKHPHEDKVMIKRLIGLPGDRIQVVNNQIILNGEVLPQEPIDRVTYRDYRTNFRNQSDELLETNPDGVSYLVHDIIRVPNRSTPVIFIVPEGHYFFMGDNRDNSTDARALSGHCPPNASDVIDRAGCDPDLRPGEEASIGFVPYDNLIGRADTVLFTLNFCSRYISGCPEGRVWKSL